MSSSKVDLNADELRAHRLRAQGLYPQFERDELPEAVRAVVGVQAQLSAALLLALRARVTGLTPDDVNEAIAHKQLVRSWLMRGTLHLVHAEDVRWLLNLLSPAFIAGGKRRRAQLGLDEAVSRKGLDALREILSGSPPLTRGEIVEKLSERGIALDRRSQAPIHLIGLAALEGIVCLGPDAANGESTYVLMDDWVKPAQSLPREQALADLARRYLSGYAPASPKDFAAWSGLAQTDAKQAWKSLSDRDQIVELRVEGRTLWRLKTDPKRPPKSTKPLVRLLPAFDTYILGYADRDFVVTPEHQSMVYHGGQTVPVVLVDGAAVGVWRYKRQGKRLQVSVHPFEPFNPQLEQLVAEEADDIGRFWNASVSVTYSANPV